MAKRCMHFFHCESKESDEVRQKFYTLVRCKYEAGHTGEHGAYAPGRYDGSRIGDGQYFWKVGDPGEVMLKDVPLEKHMFEGREIDRLEITYVR